MGRCVGLLRARDAIASMSGRPVIVLNKLYVTFLARRSARLTMLPLTLPSEGLLAGSSRRCSLA
jgi:hypothetical protein